jgi:adenylate cyclase
LTQVFVSYAHSTEATAVLVDQALQALGYEVWRDDQLPSHRAFTDVIDEHLLVAKAVVVLWSVDAVKSDWVRAEADRARKAGTLVQLTLDGATLPLPFDQIQCADLRGWQGDINAGGWRSVAGSVAALVKGDGAGRPSADAPPLLPPPLPDKPSIAILPFADLSPKADQDYFAQGMMDEIVTALSRIRSLFVIASSATLSLKGQALGAQEIAQRLGVRYILDGSVRRSGERVRITVGLTDAATGAQIWSERFDDTLEDVFALQDRVALAVAGVIEPSVLSQETRRAARRPLESLGAYDLYLRAAPLRATLQQADVLQALALLERAIAAEPSFAPALAQAAGCHSQVYANGWADDAQAHRQAGLALARRAVAAGADDAQVLAQTGNAVMELDNDVDHAAALIDRAIALNPGSAYAWLISGIICLVEGDGRKAVEHFERAARLDPISHLGEVARAHIGVGTALQGDFQTAVRQLRGSSHRSARIHMVLAALYGHLGQFDDAEDELALYAGSVTIPVETMARFSSRDPQSQAIILSGLAKTRQRSAG